MDIATAWVSWKNLTISFLFIFSLVLFLRPPNEHRVYLAALSKWIPIESSQAVVAEEEPRTHPVDVLIDRANTTFLDISARIDKPVSLKRAAAEYRQRRGRHPPPQFDSWYEFARSKDSPILEDFFDQIYEDLEPFWAVDPETIRTQAANFPHVLSFRDGRAERRVDNYMGSAWLNLWAEGLDEITPFLPDVDIAFNDLDEARVVAPNEVINELINKASRTRHIANITDTIHTSFTSLPKLPSDIPSNTPRPWTRDDVYWETARKACSNDTPAHNLSLDTDLTTRPYFPQTAPSGSYQGYVSNWTYAKSACHHPHLRNLHGALTSPRFRSFTDQLFPLFSGCKQQGINNDILVPPAMYWSADDAFSVATSPALPWHERSSSIVWRGQASGGKHTADNWTRFQRHRLLAMLNASLVDRHLHAARTAIPEPLPWNFPLPNTTLYPPSAPSSPLAHFFHSASPNSTSASLGAWLAPLSDAAFVHFLCDPWVYSQFTPGNSCSYLDEWYHTAPPIPMAEQFRHKYLPDVDGQSYSGRYRSFLRSGSLPIKATIFAEWHDARLVAWRHFVPMDNTFVDWWGIAEYFLGHRVMGAGEREVSEGARRDAVAQGIAEGGRAWAERVLRREDMLVYMYRLILEYARICDERRESMGWVADLKGD